MRTRYFTMLPPTPYNTTPNRSNSDTTNLSSTITVHTCRNTHIATTTTTTTTNNNNQSAHDLEWCGQESEWSVEHRFEFPVCEGENVFVSFALHDGHDNDDELASVSIKPGPLTSREVYEMHDERGDLAGRIKVSVML
mmetsp:Transcript_89598/g.255926  ORF Transcript_89598/g.255926 Transcript_89598/m.255926 type:complete len:138 (-) Transcript_89598:309-722(-)